jgi:hypothetical protein
MNYQRANRFQAIPFLIDEVALFYKKIAARASFAA